LAQTDYFNLVIANTDTADVSQKTVSDLSVAGALTVSSGTIDFATQTASVAGTTTVSGGTLLAGTAASTFTGAVSISGGTFTGSSGTADMLSNLNISSGTFVAPTTLNLTGNFTNAGTFTHNSGTVNLLGVNQTITPTSATTFASLLKIDTTNNATDSTLTLAGNILIATALTLDGIDTDDRLNIISSVGGSARSITFTGSSTFTGDFLDITDSTVVDTSSGVTVPINPTSSIDGGNTTDWFTTTHTISGTVYTDQGVTNIGAGKTIRVLVNGTGAITGTTNASGQYSISVPLTSAGDVITAHIDGATEDGATITRTAGADITGFDIYQDRIIVRNESVSAISIANLNTGNDGDADLITLYTDGVSPTFQSGKELFIWAGDTFTPGAALDVDGNVEVAATATLTLGGTLDVDGNIDNKGTLVVGAHAITVGGNYTHSAVTGIYTANAGTTITFDGTGAQTFISGGATYKNIVNANTIGSVAIGGFLTVGETFTNTGTFDLVSHALTVTGAVSNTGTIKLNGQQTVTLTSGNDVDSGTWEYYGDGTGTSTTHTIKDFGTTDYYNLTFNDVSASNSDTFQIGSTLTVAGSLTATDGTFNASTSPVVISGNLTIGAAGTFTASSNSVSLAGNFTNAGVFNANSGLMNFTGVNQTITPTATTTFYSFQKQDTLNDGVDEVLTLAGNINITGIAGVFVGLDSDDRLNIVSSTPGVAHTITFTGSSVISASYVDVTDSTIADSSTGVTVPVNPSNSVNGGNTTNWFGVFGGLLYQSNGSTLITSADKDITLYVNGVFVGTDTTDGTGAYSIALSNSLNAGDTIMVFIDGETEDGVTTSVSNGSSPSDFDVWADTLIIRNDHTGITTTANINTADGTPDSDVAAIYTITGNDLTLVSNKNLVVHTNDVFTAAGTITANDVTVASSATLTLGGTLDINDDFVNFGTTTLGANTVTIAGDWYNDATIGSISAGTSTVMFDGTATQTITSGGNAFNNISNTNTTSTITLVDGLSANGTFTNSTGTFSLGSQSFSITGLFTNNGTIRLAGSNIITLSAGNDIDSGTWEYFGNGTGSSVNHTIQDFGTNDYYNLIINDVSASNSDTFQLGGNLKVAGTLTITDGTFNGTSLTVDVDGSIAIAAAGAFTSTSGVLSLGGNFTNAGTFSHNNGGIILDGTNQTITPTAATTFASLTKTEVTNDSTNSTLTLAGNITISTALALQGLDSNDNIALVSSIGGTARTITFTGTSIFSGQFLTVTDNTAIDTSTGLTVPVNPTSSINGGNTIDWFSVYIVYDTSTFTEAPQNDGSIATVVNGELFGDTLTVTSGALTVSTHYTVANVPGGLTAVVTASSATEFTVTLIGNAAAHANTNDIANFTLAFLDAAFTVTDAVDVDDSTKSDFIIDFLDQPVLTYAGSFTENTTNNGSVSGSIIATLSVDTFAATISAGTQVVITNVPAGLTAVATRNSATQVTFTLTGNATTHTNAVDVSNLTITWQDGAFVTTPSAANVTGYQKTNGEIDFIDVAITYIGTTFNESSSNTGATTDTIAMNLTGDIYSATVVSGNHVTATNVPTGLTASFTRVSDTQVTLALSGSAAAHANANDVSNLTVTFDNSAFTAVTVASNVTNYLKNNLVVDFADPATAIINYSGSFDETATNNGAVSGSIVATLSGDTFTAGVTNGNPFTLTTHYTISNVPAGLTAVLTKTSSTVATLTLTGNATTHTNAADVSNLTLTFQTAAFTTSSPNTTVTGYQMTDGSTNFIEIGLVYGSSLFTESATNNGAISNTILVTLVGDTFSPTLTAGSDLTYANVPAGLTGAVTRNSATTATLSLTGNATTHTNASSISNLTVVWADSAFVTSAAADIDNSTKSNITVTFLDPALVTYSGSFTESASNDGSVTGSRVATVTGDTFVNTGLILVENTHFTLTNKPAGLTAVMTVNGAGTTATLTFTGNATTHTNAVDVANLGITFLDGAFTSTPLVANINSPSNTTGAIDFIDVTLAYDITTLLEAIANDGSIGNNPITITLAGDTFSATVVSGSHVTAANVPTGMTAVFTRASNTTVTMSLTGNATSHLTANDVNNLSIFFANASFSNATASNVTNSSKTNLVVDFTDQASIAYSGAGFVEAAANDGSVTGSIIATITGDTFQDTDADNVLDVTTEIVLGNVPAGLTPVITLTSGDTIATITLTGNAAPHLNANDVANITVTFVNGAFTNTTLAANVTNATGPYSTNLGVDFQDPPSIAYSTGIFTESSANNGAIANTSTLTITNETFALGNVTLTLNTHYTVANVPPGLTVTLVTNAAKTQAVMTLTGTATAHANINDVSNLTVTFLNSAFTAVAASNVTNATKNDIIVNFADQPSVLYAGNFTESATNNGSLTGSRVATVTGDTFVNANSTLTENTHFTLSNKPAGLTAVMTVNAGGTTATLTFTGSASAHLPANSVSNLGITFLDGAFTNTTSVANVTNPTNTLGTVTFIDVSLAYSLTTFTESSANDGAIGNNPLTITLTGDTFSATVVSGGFVTAANIPVGLTGTFTRTSDTTVSLSLSGNALAHANANDISNVTIMFTTGAFTNAPPAQVTNSTNAAIAIDFTDAAVLSYSGSFAESVSNNGSVTGSIIATLSGDTFAGTITAGTHVLVTNVPGGLTAVATRNSATQVTFTLTGNATTHTNAVDVSNLTITWQNGAFASTAVATNVSGATKTDGSINFIDVDLTYSGSTFTESTSNNGSISNTITATLSGDAFALSGTLTSGVHFTPSNVPVGLTMAVSVNALKSIATISLTGSATTHTNAVDIANMGISIYWKRLY
jgi:hypothetical protein